MKDIKTFNVRLSHENWFFLKIYSAEKNKTMNDIITAFVEKLKNKKEKDVDMLKC